MKQRWNWVHSPQACMHNFKHSEIMAHKKRARNHDLVPAAAMWNMKALLQQGNCFHFFECTCINWCKKPGLTGIKLHLTMNIVMPSQCNYTVHRVLSSVAWMPHSQTHTHTTITLEQIQRKKDSFTKGALKRIQHGEGERDNVQGVLCFKIKDGTCQQVKTILHLCWWSTIIRTVQEQEKYGSRHTQCLVLSVSCSCTVHIITDCQ